jgi:heptosyltransferase-3
MQPYETDLNPSRLRALVLRRLPIVLVCVAVAVGVAIAYSLHAEKKYTATASLLFNNAPLSQQIAGLGTTVASNSPSQQDTNTQLLKLGDLAQKTAAQVGHGLTSGEVAGSISVTATGDTTVVTVASTLPSSTLAAAVANTYAKVFVSEQENGDHRYYESALNTVESQIAKLSPAEARGAQGLALQERAQSLATLAQLRTGSVSLAQAAAVPSGPSSPDTKRNVLLAVVLGLVLGALLALAIERLDQNIRDPEELERTYELPLLGAVPQSSALRRGKRGGGSAAPPPEVAEAFQFVRARLRYFNVDRELRTLAVVSAQPGDGKTTVAHWLATAAAGLGSHTLLIETDLRRPTMALEVKLEQVPGLADVLIGRRSFHDAIQTQNLSESGEDGSKSIDVLVAGALPPNPTEMLESQAMAEVLETARAEYGFVVIDTPPLGAVSDALPLVRAVDGVAIVAGMGDNRRDAARRLKATLASVDAPVLGVIANRVRARDSAQYGYGYGYSSNDVVGGPDRGSVSSGTRADLRNASGPADASLRVEPPAAPANAATSPLGQPIPIENGSSTQPSSRNGRVVGSSTDVVGSPPARRPDSELRGPVRRGRPERVIIYRLGSIGDAVVALPCFHLIESVYPNAERIALTNVPVSSKAAPLEAVLKDGGFIHGSIPYRVGLRSPLQLRRLAKELRDQEADTIIYLTSRGGVSAWRDVAFFGMCGFKNIVGAPLDSDLQVDRVGKDGYLERESHRLARSLQTIGAIDLSDRSNWDLRLTEREHAAAAERLGAIGARRFLAIHAGGKALQNDWGMPAWTSLLSELGSLLRDLGLVIVGGGEDRDRAAQLAARWHGETLDLTGTLAPRESAAALSRAVLFIGHDSGPLHLADAVGTPAVGLFGDNNPPKKWHPSGARTRIIHNMSGIHEITPQQVIEQATDLIGLVSHV